MYDSLLTELRFRIGEQYELNEFNLKSIESTFINGIEYENYEYIKDDFKTLFGVELLSNITLQYNADILSRVIYEFDIKHYNYLKDKIRKHTCYDITLEAVIKDKSSFKLLIKKM